MPSTSLAPDFRILFESVPGLYLVLAPDLTIVAVTHAYLKATMTERDAIVGRGIFDVFPDNPQDMAATGSHNLAMSLNRVLQNRVPDTMAVQKYDVRRPDGTFEERYWSPINCPVLGENGEIFYIIHRVEDVTDFIKLKQVGAEQRARAEELRTRTGQMEAEMFHRAQELQQANTQLRAVNEELARKEKALDEGSEGLQRMATQLEGANKELEAFSYSVSHDLRAPVRHIAGYVELLEEHARPLLSEKGHRYIKTIAESAKQMGTLIDDLLAFSKMGRIEFSEAVVNLELLLKEVMEDLKPDLEGRTIEWNIGVLPCVPGDPSMLRQVFSNLLSNAVKFTAKRAEAKIEVGVAFDRQLAHETVLFVRDNGDGFDMEYAHKLFGVFQRLHRASEFEGTGIGLANVRRIIERHGGRTWAEGAVGAGAVFYFSLPNRGGAGD